MSVTDPYMGQPAPFPYQKPTAGSDVAKTYVFTGNPIIIGYQSGFNAGRIYQMNATFEWEPFSSWLVRAGYVGTRGTHLNTSYDNNAPVFIAGTDSNGNPLSTNANQQSRRPYTAFQKLSLTSADANSWYNAMQISVNKRFAHQSSGSRGPGYQRLRRDVRENKRNASSWLPRAGVRPGHADFLALSILGSKKAGEWR